MKEKYLIKIYFVFIKIANMQMYEFQSYVAMLQYRRSPFVTTPL